MDKLIAAKGDAVQPAVEALAEQLIGFLDATAGDPTWRKRTSTATAGLTMNLRSARRTP